MRNIAVVAVIVMVGCAAPQPSSWRSLLPPELFRQSGQVRIYKLAERRAAAYGLNLTEENWGIYGDPGVNAIRVIIVGGVPRQGVFHFTKDTTLCEALIEAGGLDSFWYPKHAQIGRDGKLYDIDFRKRKPGGVWKVLKDGDWISVPVVM